MFETCDWNDEGDGAAGDQVTSERERIPGARRTETSSRKNRLKRNRQLLDVLRSLNTPSTLHPDLPPPPEATPPRNRKKRRTTDVTPSDTSPPEDTPAVERPLESAERLSRRQWRNKLKNKRRNRNKFKAVTGAGAGAGHEGAGAGHEGAGAGHEGAGAGHEGAGAGHEGAGAGREGAGVTREGGGHKGAGAGHKGAGGGVKGAGAGVKGAGAGDKGAGATAGWAGHKGAGAGHKGAGAGDNGAGAGHKGAGAGHKGAGAGDNGAGAGHKGAGAGHKGAGAGDNGAGAGHKGAGAGHKGAGAGDNGAGAGHKGAGAGHKGAGAGHKGAGATREGAGHKGAGVTAALKETPQNLRNANVKEIPTPSGPRARSSQPVAPRDRARLQKLKKMMMMKSEAGCKKTEPPREEEEEDPHNTEQSEADNSAGGGGRDRSAELRARMEERLNSARFRYINQQLYTSSSQEARRLFLQDPQAFSLYHSGFSQQVQRWPINPITEIIKYIKNRPSSLVVADFGCGDALLARSVRNKVHSFDLVALNDHVTVCDIAEVPLQDGSVDVAVFCLSLMGTNLSDFLQEAHRVLKSGGVLLVAEVSSRFDDVRQFLSAMSQLGFKAVNKNTENSHFFLFEFSKSGRAREATNHPGLQLKPCLYKKR